MTKLSHKRPMKKKSSAHHAPAVTSSQQLTIDELAPVRAWAQANPGAIGRLAEKVGEITGEPVNRHMVGRWLKETDPVQPRFGYGIALVRAYESLANEDAGVA